MDLFSRDGKNSHAFAFDLVNGYYDFEKNQQILPSVLLLTNVSKTNLSLTDINTLFHEFGHTIHGILSGYKSKYYELTINNVETDFVEAPSQFIEIYLRDKNVIKAISNCNGSNGSNEESGEKIPETLLSRYFESLTVGESRKWTRVATQALYDLMIHTQEPIKSEELIHKYKELMNRNLFQDMGPGGSLGTWGHLMAWGYDSSYYSYVFSIVTASNLYSAIQNGTRTNREYRELLEMGSKKPMNRYILEFLKIDSIQDISIENFIQTFIQN